MISIHSNTEAIIERVLDRVHQLQPGGAVYNAAMREAADTQLKATVERIHTNGTASDGSQIGEYSTTPMYMNPVNSPVTFQPVGKTGRETFIKSGKPHLTRYFDEGYRDFRQQIGLAADKVVLTLRGDLRDGLEVKQTAQGYGLGWDDEELYNLSQVLEAKYAKPIWAPTGEETTELLKGFEQKVAEALKG